MGESKQVTLSPSFDNCLTVAEHARGYTHYSSVTVIGSSFAFNRAFRQLTFSLHSTLRFKVDCVTNWSSSRCYLSENAKTVSSFNFKRISAFKRGEKRGRHMSPHCICKQLREYTLFETFA